ncbi:enoyl-CoA hydratase/isomerase family protein [Myxococcota bacterium]|nr:enoyl-CoA hydratase/isomerase family protein [Myxococcota bacterium]
MSSPLALTDLDEAGVLTITMNRPERRNAMNADAFRAVGEAFVRAQSDPRVATVLLTGAGEDFSSGLDLTSPGGAAADGGPPPFEFMMDAICALEKPLVAAVRGCAIGYGMTVLFHCDVVYVGESLRLRLPFVALGLVPEAASSYLLPALIARGPGTCVQVWIAGYPDVVREQLAVAADMRILCGLAVGYPDPHFPANSLRIGRDRLDQHVVFFDE